ncbi:MAG: hypothetical protein NT131_04480 [Methanomassiliicoccales archaeon]|nr:hypothetical protein [Methanomassiliicoccales archaeon]
MSTKRILTTPEERRGVMFGIMMGLAWFLVGNFLLVAAIFDAQTQEDFYTPFFVWVSFGPLLTFIFLGRHIMRFELRMVTGSLSNISNAMISAVSFLT